ncbi:MAG: hypothetical protein HY293_21330 [Planctomycetes bacterium]|nr:hypothetical protein [Planctomycetota bacterium]
MANQRPGRPTTRLGQPAVNVPASKPAAKPATSRGRASGPPTRSGQRQGSSRPVPVQAAKSNSTMMIAIGGAVVALLGIGGFMMSGSSEKHEMPAPKETSKPRPPDVGGLEREGMSKCDQGLALIKKNEALLGSHSLNDGQKSSLRADLEKGKKLISDGMGLLTQANEKSGNKYDTTQYQEALITVRKKLMELRD